MIDVFISHHTSTCLQVTERICESLEESGVRCWYAPRNVSGTYADDIILALSACKVFVLVLNHESSISKHVLNEIDIAVQKNIPILPFQIANETIGNAAQYYICRWHRIDAVTPPLEERIEELKTRIQAILNCSQTQGVTPVMGRLRSSNLLPNNHFLGRKREIFQLFESLQDYNKVFVQGMGGIGKSELVKAYAAKYKELYHTVVFATYETNLQDLIIYDAAFSMDGIKRVCDSQGRLETDEKFFERKLRALQEACDERTLLIIDNFDTDFDPFLEPFLQGNYSVIFTTRNDFSDLGLPVVEVHEMDAETEQMELFLHYYKRPLRGEQTETVKQILEMVHGHTLAIELISKFMILKRMQPEKMLSMLQEQGIRSLDSGTVSHGFAKAQSVYANIQSLFGMYQLSEGEIYVLMNLSMIPIAGVEFDVFMDLCHLEDAQDIDGLIKKSWIRYDFGEDKISLHPLIAETVQKECEVTLEKCSVMVLELTESLKKLWGMTLEEKLRYTNIGKSIYEKFPVFDIHYAEFYLWIGFGVTLQEQFELAEKIYKDCLEGYRKTYGEVSAQVGDTYYRLGDLEGHRQNPEGSIPYLKKAIEIFEQVMPNSERLAYMIKFLCWILLGNTKEYEITEKYLHRSNELLRAQSPLNMSQIASQDSAYATLYYLTGQYENALAHAEEAYDVFFNMHGDVHGDTLAPMGIKSRILSKMGRGEEAVELCQKVIRIQKTLNGETHNKVLGRYEQLAEIYVNLGDLEKAKETLLETKRLLEEKEDTAGVLYRKIKSKLEELTGE